jgi:hypothetical protein
MEPRGFNRWQSVANRISGKSDQIGSRKNKPKSLPWVATVACGVPWYGGGRRFESVRGFCKGAGTRDSSALLNLQEVQFAVVMELFMEHRKCRRAECPRRVGDGGPLALLSHSQCRISAFQGRELVPVEDDPHTVAWTRPDEINAGLLDLLAGNPRAKLQRSLRQGELILGSRTLRPQAGGVARGVVAAHGLHGSSVWRLRCSLWVSGIGFGGSFRPAGGR